MNEQQKHARAETPPPPRVSKGQLSRETILLTAARLATTSGLVGLSIGELAEAVGMSKSGLYAHFQSKEELELATIETAVGIFDREILQPGLNAPPGLQRLRLLFEGFLDHLERRVFPGGCFFAAAAAELDTRPGPARDRIVAILHDWLTLLGGCLVDARKLGEIDRRSDLDQATFEIEALLVAANFLFVINDDRSSLDRARTGFQSLLRRLSPARATARRKRPVRGK